MSDVPTVTIDMDVPCSRCGVNGATQSGLCLGCILKTRLGGRMAMFMGMPISKETISLGLGGQIDRGGEDFAPRSTIKFEAMAVVSSIKHKFLKDGTVEESTIMVIDPESFRVRGIAEPPQDDLPGMGGGSVSVADADAVAAKMRLKKADGTVAVGGEKGGAKG